MKKTLLSMAFAFAALATGGLNAAEVTDVLTTDGLGITGSGYKDFSGKSFTSEAVYAGNAMRATKNSKTGYAGGGIQLRNKSNTGIVTTTSGGAIVKVAMHFDYPSDSDNEKGRTVTIYGSNTPYNSSADLYGDNKGDVLGTLSSGVEDGEITVNGNYAYVGIHADGAVYLREISITWETGGEVLERVEAPTFSVADGMYMEATDVTISCATAGATIHYTVNGEAEQTGTAGESVIVPLADNGTYTITAYATAEGMTDSAPAEATYTIWFGADGFFKETFDGNTTDEGGNDGKWSGISNTNEEINTDMAGWTFTNGYAADKCIKLATGSKAGKATTPALEGIGSYAKLTFLAGSWSGDGTTLNLSISGGGQLSETSFELPDGAWGVYTVYIENATVASKVEFSSASGKRYFLDEVVIANEAMTQLVTPGFSGVTDGASYYDEATVEIACATEGATINYTVTKDDVADEPVTGATSPVSVRLTDAGRYTVTATASKDGETSAEATINFTIKESYSYEYLDPNGEIKEGTYMIVAADGSGQYYMMKNAVQSTNYVQAEKFDFGADPKTFDTPYYFFVEKADGGYYIKNFDQTYVALVENGTRTYLKPAEATPFVWAFSGTKDAVVATGTEITVPMGYDVNYNNFAADATDVKPMFIYVNNETSGVEATMAGGVAVAGVDGAIAVAADETVSVAVYTAAGQLAVSTEVAAGTTELSVAPGFYIVKAGDVVKKVIVK